MGAPDLLRHLRGAGFTLSEAAGGGIRVVPAGALTDDHRQAIRNHRAELLALLAGTTTPTASASPAPEFLAMVAWTDADIARFAARRDRLTRWGWPAAEAEATAQRLTLRDRAGDDDRVSCAECKGYRPGRCGNHRAARLQSPEVGRDLAALLQRCPGFMP